MKISSLSIADLNQSLSFFRFKNDIKKVEEIENELRKRDKKFKNFFRPTYRVQNVDREKKKSSF